MQNENPRILVLWKTRIGDFFFLENQNPRILVLWKTRLREFSFYGKQESGDLWKKKGGVRRCAALCREGDRRCAALCGVKEKTKKKGGTGAVRTVRKKKKKGLRRCAEGDRRCAALCGKKKKFTLEFSFCGKRESGNSLFLESETPRILVLWKTRIRKFVENENSRFVENENPRILVLWKTRIRRFVEKKKARSGAVGCYARKKKKKKGGLPLCGVVQGGGPALCGAVRS